MSLQYKTNIGKYTESKGSQPSPRGKQKVLFVSHPADFDIWFDVITDEILAKQPNCAIYFYEKEDNITAETMNTDLLNVILFVIPVSINLMRDDCDIQKYLDFASLKNVRLLFIQVEHGIGNLFNAKYGSYQLLNKDDSDVTSISYKEKMSKFLESVIIGEELEEEIRQAFNAYIFLSYRKKDRRLANELMRIIHSNDFCRDIAIWYDEYLTPGEDFNDAIVGAIEKSGLFIMLVTPNLVNEENYVHKVEYYEAKRANKPIFPVEAEKTDRDKLVLRNN